jgi:transcriptional regulator
VTLYNPPHFKADDPRELLAFIRRHAFGTLVSTGAAGLEASHVPFEAEIGPGGAMLLQGHLARSNPHWKSLEGAADILVMFQGPHGYVSPGWYEQQPSVPTWNYAVVHARGHAHLMDEAGLHDLVVRLSNTYEAGRPQPWRATDLPAGYVQAMLGHIVGFEIEVGQLEGKFKLSQNRPAEIPRVVAALERDGAHELAALMRDHAPSSKG